jgi:hypothetical protein
MLVSFPHHILMQAACSLANHGFLPRDGRNLTIRNVLQAGLDGFNVQSDLLLLPAKIGLTAGPEIDTFTLADIRLYVFPYLLNLLPQAHRDSPQPRQHRT